MPIYTVKIHGFGRVSVSQVEAISEAAALGKAMKSNGIRFDVKPVGIGSTLVGRQEKNEGNVLLAPYVSDAS